MIRGDIFPRITRVGAEVFAIKYVFIMKQRFLIFSSFIILLIFLTGCTKTIGRYYIKYEVSVSGNYGGGLTYATVNTENGKQEFDVRSSFSEIFGPVKHNFIARVEAFTKSSNAIVTVRIYACKGEEAFALKETKTMQGPTVKHPLVVEYKINF